VRLEYQGYVPWDDAVPRAIRSQEPVVVGAPHTPASLAIAELARRLVSRPATAPTGGLQFFFQQLLEEAVS